MSGFVGTRARKKKRNFIILIITIILIIVFYLVLPSINFTKEELLPEEKILPDNNDNISSLASTVEELRTIIFQKDQKIKFRDSQLNNLKINLQKITKDYELKKNQLKILQKEYEELNIKAIENDDLIQIEDFNSLQDNFTNLKKNNNKNIKIIQDLNDQLKNLELKLSKNKENVLVLLNENDKLKKDLKNSFLNEKTLLNQINDLRSKIETLNQEVEKLKDVTHH